MRGTLTTLDRKERKKEKKVKEEERESRKVVDETAGNTEKGGRSRLRAEGVTRRRTDAVGMFSQRRGDHLYPLPSYPPAIGVICRLAVFEIFAKVFGKKRWNFSSSKWNETRVSLEGNAIGSRVKVGRISER